MLYLFFAASMFFFGAPGGWTPALGVVKKGLGRGPLPVPPPPPSRPAEPWGQVTLVERRRISSRSCLGGRAGVKGVGDPSALEVCALLVVV